MTRKDLFAVKVRDDCGWVYETITRNRRFAFQYRADVASNFRRSFPLVEPKVVHPPQHVVDLYVLAGNTIGD